MRWKLLAGNVIALFVVGLLGWFLVKGRAQEALTRDVAPSVQRAQALLDAVRAQDADLLLDSAQEAGGSSVVETVFAADNESAAREAAFRAAESLGRQFVSLPRRGRPPELLAFVNEEGRVLARNADRNLDVGRNLRSEFPAVARALEGHPVRDYIRYGEQGWMEVAVVPVRREGRVRGALVVGFNVADSAARSDAERIGVDVGYLFREGGRLTVQSLSAGSQREKEEMVAWVNSPAAGGENIFRSRNRFSVQLGGSEYLAQVMPMPGAFTQQAGAVVLRSLTAARSPAGDLALPVLLAMALGIAIAVGVNLAVTASLQKNVEAIEGTLLQMIQGNDQVRVEVKDEELGGIVTNINTLVDRLTNVEGEG